MPKQVTLVKTQQLQPLTASVHCTLAELAAQEAMTAQTQAKRRAYQAAIEPESK